MNPSAPSSMPHLFTPGPWWAHTTDVGQIGSIETLDGLPIAKTQPLPDDQQRVQRNANAKLCAAAPDLLETAENFLGLFDNPVMRRKLGDDPFYQDAIQQARAAVTKALQHV